MNGWIKPGVAIVFLVSLTSCSIFGKDSNGDDCVDGSCDGANNINRVQQPRSWYCYGVQQDRSWDCTKVPQPEKIATIVPGSVQSAAVINPVEDVEEQSAGLQAAVIASEPALPVIQEIQEVQEVQEVQEANSTTGSEVILSLPGDFFTVQLIAMKIENKVLDYATTNGMDKPLYVRILSQDTGWYVLLLGTYPDRSTAEKAKADWESARVLKVQPWIRRLSPLQEAIRLALDP